LPRVHTNRQRDVGRVGDDPREEVGVGVGVVECELDRRALRWSAVSDEMLSILLRGFRERRESVSVVVRVIHWRHYTELLILPHPSLTRRGYHRLCPWLYFDLAQTETETSRSLRPSQAIECERGFVHACIAV